MLNDFLSRSMFEIAETLFERVGMILVIGGGKGEINGRQADDHAGLIILHVETS